MVKMESENPSAEFAFDNQLTKVEFPDSFKSCLEENDVKMECEYLDENYIKCSSPELLRSEQSCEEDTSNKCIVSTDEQESQQPRLKKTVLNQEKKKRRNASCKIESLSDEQREHRRVRQRFYRKKWTPEQRQKKRLSHRKSTLTPEQLEHKNLHHKEYLRCRRRKIQEQRKLEEKSGRIEALAKMRQENMALKEQLKHITESLERKKIRNKIYKLNKKEILLETAIDGELEQIPPNSYNQKPTPTAEQRERRRLDAIQYRLKMKQKKIDSTSNTPLEIKSE